MPPNNNYGAAPTPTANESTTNENNTNENPSHANPQEINFFLRVVKRYALLGPSDFVISVDNFPIWRRHLAWSKGDGKKFRDLLTQRFASNMVFMSLLLSAEVGVLFSPSRPSETMRQRLRASQYEHYDFWAGLVLCISIFLSLCTLVATFTAWAIVSAVSDKNSHTILRSQIGLYGAQLPSRIIVGSVYGFLIWMVIFMFILLPKPWAVVVSVCSVALFVHIVSVYSSLARTVMWSSAMANDPIFELQEEESMLPHQLEDALVEKAWEEKRRNTQVMHQYRNHSESFAHRRRLADLEAGASSSSSGVVRRKGSGREVDKA